MDNDDLALLDKFGYSYQETLHEPNKSKSDDTLVMLVKDRNGRLLAVKRQHGCNACLDYEYQAGLRLFTQSQEGPPSLRIIPETVAYFVDASNSRQYLVTEYVAGEALASIIERYKDLDQSQRYGFTRWYIWMLRTILEFSRQYGFTHYDLHAGNILVSMFGDSDPFFVGDLDSPTGLQPLRPVAFKLIDFGYSHVPGVTGWVRAGMGSLFIGAIPSVWDLWYDVVRLICVYHLFTDTPLNSDEETLLTGNRFSAWVAGDDDDDFPEYILFNEQSYPGSELIPGIGRLHELSPSLWDDGFWVPKASDVDCKTAMTPVFSARRTATVEEKISFGNFLTCIKLALIRKRKYQDPSRLIDAFEKAID